MNDPVLSTGITGYIGQHCAAELLRQGYEVVGTIRSRTLAPAGFTTQVGTVSTAVTTTRSSQATRRAAQKEPQGRLLGQRGIRDVLCHSGK